MIAYELRLQVYKLLTPSGVSHSGQLVRNQLELLTLVTLEVSQVPDCKLH